MSDAAPVSTRFQRYLLPGLAFKAVVIGGGYATGRELVEFFLPHGLQGGLLGIGLTCALWSCVCSLTFLLAFQTASFDYRAFFGHLLGRGWIVFEAAYLFFIVVLLAVFGAAAGEIVARLAGAPQIVGTFALVLGITCFTALGNKSVERLFKWVSVLLYGVYAAFVALCFWRFGPDIQANVAESPPGPSWVGGGLTYASYNVVGAVIVLPTLRHLQRRRDAVAAGLLAGPLAIIPALLFFCCMAAFYPRIGAETLPSDYMLSRIGFPLFQACFQIMVLAALLESGTGSVHAIVERVAATVKQRRGSPLGWRSRTVVTLTLLLFSIFIATQFGLVALIARGYTLLAFVMLAVYLLPVCTVGLYRIVHPHMTSPAPSSRRAEL